VKIEISKTVKVQDWDDVSTSTPFFIHFPTTGITHLVIKLPDNQRVLYFTPSGFEWDFIEVIRHTARIVGPACPGTEIKITV